MSLLPGEWRPKEPYSLMSVDSLDWLDRHLRSVVAPAGSLLVAQDQPMTHVGILARGHAELIVRGRRSEPKIFDGLAPGELFGFTALFYDGLSPYSVRTTAPAVCMVLDPEVFEQFLARDMALREYFYREALRRAGLAYRKACAKETPCDCDEGPARPVSTTIEKALAFLNARYMDPVTLADVAAACGASKYHFSRRFNAETGFTLTEYLSRVRVAVAKKMLRQKNVNISEACFAVGFNELSYFSRVFRKIEGQSPSAYRKSF